MTRGQQTRPAALQHPKLPRKRELFSSEMNDIVLNPRWALTARSSEKMADAGHDYFCRELQSQHVVHVTYCVEYTKASCSCASDGHGIFANRSSSL
jgi:hypothetical protein